MFAGSAGGSSLGANHPVHSGPCSGSLATTTCHLVHGSRRQSEPPPKADGGLLLDTVGAVLEGGQLRPPPANLVAGTFYGAPTELSITVAEIDEPQQARSRAAGLVRDLIGGAVPTGNSTPSA